MHPASYSCLLISELPSSFCFNVQLSDTTRILRFSSWSYSVFLPASFTCFSKTNPDHLQYLIPCGLQVFLSVVCIFTETNWGSESCRFTRVQILLLHFWLQLWLVIMFKQPTTSIHCQLQRYFRFYSPFFGYITPRCSQSGRKAKRRSGSLYYIVYRYGFPDTLSSIYCEKPV